jgi:hypothetical protein
VIGVVMPWLSWVSIGDGLLALVGTKAKPRLTSDVTLVGSTSIAVVGTEALVGTKAKARLTADMIEAGSTNFPLVRTEAGSDSTGPTRLVFLGT